MRWGVGATWWKRVRGPQLRWLFAAAALGVFLLAALAGALAFTLAKDPLTCENTNRAGLTALSLAADNDAANKLLIDNADVCGQGQFKTRLRETIKHDVALIVAYATALTYWLRLGKGFARLNGRRSVLSRLSWLVPVAGSADVANSALLWLWLDVPTRDWAIAGASVTAWLKWSVVIPALVLTAAVVVDVFARLGRAVLLGPQSVRPAFFAGTAVGVQPPTLPPARPLGATRTSARRAGCSVGTVRGSHR